jgi:hypothetical protein
MAVQTESGAVIMDTPDEIAWYRFMTGYRALSMEVHTGMKMTRGFSPVKFFADYGFKAKRIKPLLAEVQAFVKEQGQAGFIPAVVIESITADLRR